MEKKKCSFCKKRINLLEFDCKCSKIFCLKHRLPESHNCTFNFHFNREKIFKDSIKCEFKKIEKI